MKKTTMKKSSLRGSGLAWLLKADCTDLVVRVNGFGPFFLLWLAHWSMVCLCHFSFSVRRRSLTHCPPNLVLFFSSVEGDEETHLETTCCSLLILYWPLTNSLLRGSQSAHSPLPFQPSSINFLFFQFWFSSKLFSHHHHLLFTDQLEFLLKTTVLRWFPGLICCYSNRSKEAVYDGDPGTRASSLVPSSAFWNLN